MVDRACGTAKTPLLVRIFSPGASNGLVGDDLPEGRSGQHAGLPWFGLFSPVIGESLATYISKRRWASSKIKVVSSLRCISQRLFQDAEDGLSVLLAVAAFRTL